ncbi:MAG: pyridoxamine 5'-phosphate oxidase family protein [Verrucomicrobiota bacterium]
MNQSQRVQKLLRDHPTAVLITHLPDGGLRARPMAIAEAEANGDLWFITAGESAKVAEIETDPRATVVCQKEWKSCVVISGHARLERDKAKVAELWKESFRAWFPEGRNDPSIMLIHLVGEEAEFWDNTGLNKLRYAFATAKSLVTATKPSIKKGKQHGRVRLEKRRLGSQPALAH